MRADAGGCRCRGAHQAGVKLGWYGGEVCALHPRAASFPAASVLIAACRRPQSATVQASGQLGQPRCRLKLRSRGCAVRPARIGCGHRPHGFEVPVRFCQHPQRKQLQTPPEPPECWPVRGSLTKCAPQHVWGGRLRGRLCWFAPCCSNEGPTGANSSREHVRVLLLPGQEPSNPPQSRTHSSARARARGREVGPYTIRCWAKSVMRPPS